MRRAITFLFLAAISLTAASQDKLQMLVGTYTEDSTSEGVYLYSFNQETAAYELLDTARMGNPSFVIFSPEKGYAYSVSEYHDGRQAAVAYKLAPGTIDVLNDQPLGKEWHGDPCNLLWVDGNIVTANYTGGSLSFLPVSKDRKTLTGTSQAYYSPSAHMHCAILSPDGKYVFATDLGLDRILRFPASLDGLDADSFEVVYYGRKGLGPRHMVFSGDGRFAYLINELGDVLTVFGYEDGRLRKIQETVAYSGEGHGSADIHLTPDGRFLYTSHRLKGDGLGIFKVDQSTGKVKKVGFQPTGLHPRNFAVTPNGKYLLCACRDSDRIEIYSINQEDGKLKDTGKRIELGKPVCVQFGN